jgi:ribonuclease D
MLARWPERYKAVVHHREHAKPMDIETRRRLVALLKWRDRAARQQQMPVHAVLHDVTLRALAQRPPMFPGQLVNAIGTAKAGRYGDALRRVLHPST